MGQGSCTAATHADLDLARPDSVAPVLAYAARRVCAFDPLAPADLEAAACLALVAAVAGT